MRIGRRLAIAIALAGDGRVSARRGSRSPPGIDRDAQLHPRQGAEDHLPQGEPVRAHAHELHRTDEAFRAQLDFDDDIKIRTGAVPRCNSSIRVTTPCSRRWPPAERAGWAAVVPRPTCSRRATSRAVSWPSTPDANWRATEPTILFHASAGAGSDQLLQPGQQQNGNTTVVLRGLFRAASGDFGTQLDVNNIPQALPLSDFQVTVERGSYVSARCHDANRHWNLRTKFPTPEQHPDGERQPDVPGERGPPPPDTRITKSKISQKRRKAKFMFRATGHGDGLRVPSSSASAASGSRSRAATRRSLQHLKKGKYTFEVRAVGPGGKDASPAEKRFEIRRRH